MNKPIVFISSTIYDFSDLRSAIKYWLDEMDFETQLSEYNDFVKDTTLNSYDACLRAVEQCDYFVLLIGTRIGGNYPNKNKSITRKEYETAYQLAKEGRIKKIIVLIRQSVWDVKEDRRSLEKKLKQIDILEKVDIERIKYYDSKILMDAEQIISFINEVTRIDEARDKKKPEMNWVHNFSTFDDIVQVLRSELKITADISYRIAEENVKNALVYNLQNVTYRDCTGGIHAFYLGFESIRKKIVDIRKAKDKLSLSETVYLSTSEVDEMSNFFCSSEMVLKIWMLLF